MRQLHLWADGPRNVAIVSHVKSQELGASTCWLLSLIACQEDVKGFTEPAKFYFAQLMPLCGFGSPKQLRNAIAKAVELGWLEYLPGSKGIPGRFSVRVPTEFADLTPFACDESSERVPSAETQTEMQTVMGALSGNETTAERQRKRKRKGNTSLPITTPTPKEKRPRFEIPSLEEVKAYCIERANQVNPEQFHDHYEANGWVQGPSKPIRNWKAAVRTWERNGMKNTKPAKDERDEYQNFTGLGAKRA